MARRIPHLLRFNQRGVDMPTKPAAETHNDRSLLTITTARCHCAQQVIPQERGHHGDLPLQAREETPLAIVPVDYIEVSLPDLAEKLEDSRQVTPEDRSRRWMNHLYLDTSRAQRINQRLNKGARMRARLSRIDACDH